MIRVAAILGAAFLAARVSLGAEGSMGLADLAKAYDAGVEALEAGSYDEGLKTVARVIEETGAEAVARYGPSFGHFHYLRGRLLIGKKDYPAAMAALRVAVEDFGNDKRQAGQLRNVFVNHARLQWGICLQVSGDFDGAARQFETVLASDQGEAPKIDLFVLRFNLARCYLRIDRKAEGIDLLMKLLENGKPAAEAVQDVFTVLAEEGIGQVRIDALLRQHSAALLGNERMNRRFAILAARSLAAGDFEQALFWYGLVPPPGPELRAWEGEIARLEEEERRAGERGRRDLAEAAQTKSAEVRRTLAEARGRHAGNLQGMASAHYRLGSFAAARAILGELLAGFPELEQRPQILHDAIHCAIALERWDDAAALGAQFLSAFPSHPLGPGIARVLAEAEYTRGDYAASLKRAGELRKGLPAGSAERAAADFTIASALLRLNRLEEAERELLGFLAAYPDHARAGEVRYDLGLVKSQQAKWDDARRWLTEHVENSRESPFRAHALHLLSLGYLAQDQPLQALLKVNQMLAEHRSAPETAHAHNVKGDAQLALGEGYETVRASYQRARAASHQFGPEFREAGAYALKQLAALAAGAERWEEAIAWFGEFAREHPESRWRPDATVSAGRALAATGKRDEALRLLEQLVEWEAARGRGEGLERAVRSYSGFLAGALPPAERLARLRGMTAARGSPALRGMLLVAEIEACEELGEEAAAGRRAELHGELDKLHVASAEEMTGSALVWLARWRSREKQDYGVALRIYEEALQRREETGARGLALAESAALLCEMDRGGNAVLAEERFREALRVTGAGEARELSVLGLARLATDGKRWQEGEARWLEYLEQRDWRKARPEANFGYATCLDGAGRAEEALKVYISVYANFPGELGLATAACLRAAELLWNSGRRLDGLKLLQDMLRRTQGEKHPNLARAEARFFAWRDEFAAERKAESAKQTR